METTADNLQVSLIYSGIEKVAQILRWEERSCGLAISPKFGEGSFKPCSVRLTEAVFWMPVVRAEYDC
jgi:hypothetical protein